MFNAISTIYKTEGITAFWKGTGAVFGRNSICMVGMVYGYKEIESRLPAGIGSCIVRLVFYVLTNAYLIFKVVNLFDSTLKLLQGYFVFY